MNYVLFYRSLGIQRKWSQVSLGCWNNCTPQAKEWERLMAFSLFKSSHEGREILDQVLSTRGEDVRPSLHATLSEALNPTFSTSYSSCGGGAVSMGTVPGERVKPCPGSPI